MSRGPTEDGTELLGGAVFAVGDGMNRYLGPPPISACLFLSLLACSDSVDTPSSGISADSGVTQDSGTVDAGQFDDQEDDAGVNEEDAAATPDTGPIDTGMILDAGSADTGMPVDVGPADAGMVDSGMVDAGSSDASIPPCSPLPRQGVAEVFTGTIDMTDPTYDAPLAFCPTPLTAGLPPHRDTYIFCPATGPALVSIRLEAVVPNGLSDPYLVVYDGVGIPPDPGICLELNDDDGNGGNDSEISMLSIAQGQQITIVASGFSGRHFGDYKLRVTGL